MWILKYEYKHKDCLYTPKIQEFGLIDLVYTLNHFSKGKSFFVTAIHILKGEQESINKYFTYLKKIAYRCEQITQNSIFIIVGLKRNQIYYKTLYNPLLIFPIPILHKEGLEYIQLASWNREVLANLIKILEKNTNTERLKILSFKEDKLKDIFLLKVIPTLTPKQRMAFELALEKGYYNYPRKINLDILAREMKISKSNFHEILRRAESNLFKNI